MYVKKFSYTRFEPQGTTTNPDIRLAKSLVDYIFRWLGITFLPGYREAQQGYSPAAPETAAESESTATTTEAPPAAKPSTNGAKSHAPSANGNGVAHSSSNGATASTKPEVAGDDRSGQFASFQTDAPPCDNCGAITVRNGNCYLCHNCGNSMGCS